MNNKPLTDWPSTDLKTLLDISEHFSDERLRGAVPDTNKRAHKIMDWAEEFNNFHENTSWGVEADYCETISIYINGKLNTESYKWQTFKRI